MCLVSLEDEEVLNVRLPEFLEGTVKELLSGNRALLTNGVTVKGIPTHISTGDVLNIRISDNTYHSVKK